MCLLYLWYITYACVCVYMCVFTHIHFFYCDFSHALKAAAWDCSYWASLVIHKEKWNNVAHLFLASQGADSLSGSVLLQPSLLFTSSTSPALLGGLTCARGPVSKLPMWLWPHPTEAMAGLGRLGRLRDPVVLPNLGHICSWLVREEQGQQEGRLVGCVLLLKTPGQRACWPSCLSLPAVNTFVTNSLSSSTGNVWLGRLASVPKDCHKSFVLLSPSSSFSFYIRNSPKETLQLIWYSPILADGGRGSPRDLQAPGTFLSRSRMKF